MMIEPQWDITTVRTGDHVKMTVEVIGYPAVYKNFRSFTERDTIWVNTFNTADKANKTTTVAPASQSTQRPATPPPAAPPANRPPVPPVPTAPRNPFR